MDEIVTAVQFRDAVYIFCRDGSIYKMLADEITGNIQFILMAKLFPER